MYSWEKSKIIILPSILNTDGGGRVARGKDQEYKNKISLASSTPHYHWMIPTLQLSCFGRGCTCSWFRAQSDLGRERPILHITAVAE